jgi:hypothetical protein
MAIGHVSASLSKYPPLGEVVWIGDQLITQ